MVPCYLSNSWLVMRFNSVLAISVYFLTAVTHIFMAIHAERLDLIDWLVLLLLLLLLAGCHGRGLLDLLADRGE